jgi:uncharacterized membrane protein
MTNISYIAFTSNQKYRLMKATIGKIVFSLVLLIFGLFHFMNASDMSGMVPEWVPGGVFWVYATGVFLIAGALAIIINRKASLAALLLAVLLLIFVLTIHLPSVMAGGDGAQMAMTMLLKDLSMAAAALYISAHVAD